MPTFRERLGSALLGSKLDELERNLDQLADINQRLANAYEAGIYELPPDELVRQLREYYDPQLVADLVDRMNWEVVSGYGGHDEDERRRAVEDSKRMFKYGPLPRWAVNLWTYYGVGANVSIVCEDPDADEEWQAFWAADRNQRVLAKDRMDELSRWLLITGERFHAFFASTLDGEATIRSIEPGQITNILTNPDDATEAWFYERTFEQRKKQQILYYPDWELFFGEDRDSVARAWRVAQQEYTLQGELAQQDRTVVCLLFTPFIQLDEESLRGWPLLAPQGTNWFRAQREMMQDHAAVMKGKAAYIRRYQVAGGSRGVDAIKRTLASAFQYGGTSETNPPPVAGASEVVNRAVDVTDLPMTTGAADFKTDLEGFTWNAMIAAGIFPHYAGVGDAYRLATATAMEVPMQMQFSLYRNQLGAMLRKMVRITLQYKEKYGGARFETYNSDVSTDRLVEADLALTSEAVARTFRDVLVPTQQMSDGIPDEARQAITVYLLQKTLEAFGSQDVSDIIDLDMYARAPEAPEAQEAGLTEFARLMKFMVAKAPQHVDTMLGAIAGDSGAQEAGLTEDNSWCTEDKHRWLHRVRDQGHIPGAYNTNVPLSYLLDPPEPGTPCLCGEERWPDAETEAGSEDIKGLVMHPDALEAGLHESHIGEKVSAICPLCAFPESILYPDHAGLLVCSGCGKTWDPEVERRTL